MKCSNCGKEFGGGTNCQNCGIDRVTGLGNYSGYERPAGSNGRHYSPLNNGGYSPNTTVCYACYDIIPANSVYCPVCGRQLLVECPNCGTTYSTQYKICSKCGTNRDVYYKQKEAEKQRAIREEQERQRKQREWEQSPEGKAELARKEADNSFFEEVFGPVIFTIVSFVVLFILDSLVDKNWMNEVLFGKLTFRSILLGGISFALGFLCAHIINKIRKANL